MTFHHSKEHEILDVLMVSVRAIDPLPFHQEHATQHMHLMKGQQKIDPSLDQTSIEKRFTSIQQVQPKYQKSSIISNGPTPTIQATHQRHFFPSKLSSSASCWLRLQGPTAFGKTEADDGTSAFITVLLGVPMMEIQKKTSREFCVISALDFWEV